MGRRQSGLGALGSRAAQERPQRRSLARGVIGGWFERKHAHFWPGAVGRRTRPRRSVACGELSAERRVAAQLASGLSCRVCQQLVNALWADLPEPSPPAIDKWLAAGCTAMTRRALLQEGWQATTSGCDGAGHVAEGNTWCFLQDSTSSIIRRPELVSEYDPAKDALYLACQRTVGRHAARLSGFLVSQRNGTVPRARNEHLSRQACSVAACCALP